MSTQNLKPLKNDLKRAFEQNVPLTYAHLIKFERPRKSAGIFGVSSSEEFDYTYLTDAGHDISAYVGGTAATYIANKITKVGGTNETIKAKASSTTIVLDSSSLDAHVTSPIITASPVTVGSNGSLISTNTNFVDEGFREGDKISLLGPSSQIDYVRINTFTNEGLGFKFTALEAYSGSNTTDYSSTTTLQHITLVSEELTSLTDVSDRGSQSYSNYINREIYIYKVFIAAEHLTTGGSADNPTQNYSSDYPVGSIIGGSGSSSDDGGALLIFKGVISGSSLTDGPKSSNITWTASSHWADFVRVQGRKTSDNYHRAINSDGISDRAAVVRTAYSDDLGFAHAEAAVNITALYQRTETKIEIKEDKTLGIVTGVDTKEVEYDVPTEIDLKFNMQAKYLPVVYGVQRVDTIPIFADTRNHDSVEVHMLHAIAEGTVTGLYDIHVDGNSSICADASDLAVRGRTAAASDDGVIDFICKGQLDRGDTLVGYDASIGNYLVPDDEEGIVNESDYNVYGGQQSYVTPQVIPYKATSFSTLNEVVDVAGIGHERTHSFDSPIDTHLTFHQGQPFQAANNTLVNIAATSATTAGGVKKNFKVQHDYYSGRQKYWSTNHRLLDTAYMHAQYKVSEGETTLPKYKVVIKGKEVQCHNYDSSYAVDFRPTNTSASNTNFELGDIVQFYDSSTDQDTVLSGDHLIIDKWFFYDANQGKQYRFRWRKWNSSTSRFIGSSVSTIVGEKEFYMQKGVGGPKWYMTTTGATTDTNPISVVDTLKGTVTTAGTSTLTLHSSTSAAVVAAFAVPEAIVSLKSVRNESFINSHYKGFSFNPTSKIFTNLGAVDWSNSGANNVISEVVLSNGIRIPNGSTTNGEYNNLRVEVTRVLADGNILRQSRTIERYLGGTTRIALVANAWDADFIPGYDAPAGSSESIKVFLGNKDLRPSTNPSMQLLDYLKSKRYGKGLEETDIDIESFKFSAVECDTPCDVSVVTTQAKEDFATGAIYRLNFSNGKLQFQGTVSSLASHNVGNVSYTQVTFTDVIGKLGRRYAANFSYKAGEVIWNPLTGEAGLSVESGVHSTYVTARSGNNITSLALAKLSGTGSTLTIDTSIFKSGAGNPIVKSYTNNFNTFSGSGYSLYDSDDLKYWKYLGWDQPDQRNATRHQLNQVINTSQPLFSNVNKMLEQFGGILRYSLGKYSLAISSKAPLVFDSLEDIEQGDIIGNIKVTDAGTKRTYNTGSLAFPDPQNKFENREVSFYNSDYLRQDKGIPKSLTYQATGITNYFNARFNLVQKMNESRYGLNISFKIGPRGHALLPGEIIRLTYPKFGWVNKTFRIQSLNYSADSLTSISAKEHSDDIYVVSQAQSSADTLIEGGGLPIKDIPDAPTLLSPSAPGAGGINLSWEHSPSFTIQTHDTEIWMSEGTNLRGVTTATTANSTTGIGTTTISVSSTTDIASGQLTKFRNSPRQLKVSSVNAGASTVTLDAEVEIILGTEVTFFTANKIKTITGDETSWTDPVVTNSSSVTRYYWARYAVTSEGINTGALAASTKFSAFYPASPTGGLSGVAQPSSAIRAVQLVVGGSAATGNVFSYDVDGINPSPASVSITANVSNNVGAGSYTWTKKSPGETSFSSLSGFSGSNGNFTPPTAFTDTPVVIRVEFSETVGTETYTATADITITGTKLSASGADGRDSAFNYAGEYATFGTEPDVIGSGGAVDSYVSTPSLSESKALSLVATTDANSADSWAYLSTSSTHYNLPIPSNNQWVLSAFFRLKNENSPDTTHSTTQAYLHHNVAGSDSLNYRSGDAVTVPNDGDWHRKEWIFDLSSNTSIRSMIRFDNDSHTNNGNTTLYIDNVQLEIKDSTNTAKPWTLPNIGAYTLVSNLNGFTFPAAFNGAISDLTPYSEIFTLKKAGVVYTYDGSGIPRNINSFRYGTKVSSQSDYGSGNVDDIVVSGGDQSTGYISIDSSSNFATAQINHLSAYIDVQIIDNNTDNVIFTQRLAINKVPTGEPGTAARAVVLTSPTQSIAYDSSGSNPTPSAAFTITATAHNETAAGGVYYGFKKDGVSVQNTISNTYSYTPDSSFSNMPDVITVDLREGSNNSSVLATDTFTIFGLKQANDGNPGDPGDPGDPGADAITVILTNETHTVPEDASGTVDFSGSGTTIRVFEGTTELNSTNATAGNSQFKVTAVGSNVTVSNTSVGVSGNPAVISDHTAISGSLGSVTYTIAGKRSDGSVISLTKIQSITKAISGVIGGRGSGIFVFNTSDVSATHIGNFAAANFKTANTTAMEDAAQAVAAAVIAADTSTNPTITSNDRVTVANPATNITVTRIYNGSTVTSSGTIQESNWSDPVVEIIEGSAIVEGTLSADRLAANTTTTAALNVGSTLTLGQAVNSTSASIRSLGKTSATSTVNGFFLGHATDANGTQSVEFAIGGGLTGFTLMNNDGIKVVDSAGVTRVKLGNLSNL